jgi:hypothetical protein
MYSLSQDNVDFKRKITSEPAALGVLAQVARDVPEVKEVKSKGKKEANGTSKQEDQDLQTLLRLLICGKSPYLGTSLVYMI